MTKIRFKNYSRYDSSSFTWSADSSDDLVLDVPSGNAGIELFLPVTQHGKETIHAHEYGFFCRDDLRLDQMLIDLVGDQVIHPHSYRVLSIDRYTLRFGLQKRNEIA